MTTFVGAGKETLAYAKIATKGDTIPPFYITEDYVKETDDNGTPTRIEVILGRSPPPNQQGQGAFDADFHIGIRMKISKKHAMVYWNNEQKTFEIKSICKNAVKVNGATYNGSSDLKSGTPCALTSQACIQIADGTPLYFLLPKGRPIVEKPKLTYEQLLTSVLEPDKQLSFHDIIRQIQQKYPYYADESIGENNPWKQSMRSTLSGKGKVFKKITKTDPETGKKLCTRWALKVEGEEDDVPEADALMGGAGGDRMHESEGEE